MSIFKKTDCKTTEDIQNESKKVQLEISKEVLKKHKSDSTRSSIKTSGLLLVFCVVAYFGGKSLFSTQEEPCAGICEVDYSAVLHSKGYRTVSENSNTVWKVDYKAGFTAAQSELFADMLDQVFLKSVKGDKLVVHIESPGGATVACGHSYDRLERIKHRGVEVIAVVDYMAASCGYLLASAADKISVASGSMIGNIGAVMNMQPSMYDLLVKKAGAVGFVIGSTRTKELLAGGKIESQDDINTVRGLAKRLHQDFIGRVLKTRKNIIREEDYKVVFSGMIFTGTEALELGLVDQLADSRKVLGMFYMNGYKMKHITYVTPKSLF